MTTKTPRPGSDEARLALIPVHLNGVDFSKEPVITSQADAAACDINNILKAAARGEFQLASAEPVYADVSQIGDFREVRERIRHFGEYFDTLPAETRELFQNDAANLAEALGDPERHGDLAQLGLFPDDAPGATPPPPPTGSPAASTGAGTPPQA